MSKERKFIVEYWYLKQILPDAIYVGSKDCDLTSWKEGECYDVKEIVIMATNEKEALRKAPFHVTRRAKDFKIV